MAKAKKEGGIFETIKTVVVALLLAAVIRTLFVQPFWIPSGSMKPTLLIGDYLFINKMAYGYSRYSCPFAVCPISGRLFGSEPDRGDVVVFRHPVQGVDFIKRVIGLPGDTVSITGGIITVNGEEIARTDDGVFEEIKAPQGGFQNVPRCANDPVEDGGTCEKERFTETMDNGKSYSVLEIGAMQADNVAQFTIPDGQYFFMGDNRDNSQDSRYPQSVGGVGLVPAEYLLGRAEVVIFSAKGSSILKFWTWRGDRFFTRVR
ncbi:signal peptidase I [Paracoccaceae bacterium GXU_MW_L88]